MFYDMASIIAQTKIKNHQTNSALRIKMRVKNEKKKRERERAS